MSLDELDPYTFHEIANKLPLTDLETLKLVSKKLYYLAKNDLSRCKTQYTILDYLDESRPEIRQYGITHRQDQLTEIFNHFIKLFWNKKQHDEGDHEVHEVPKVPIAHILKIFTHVLPSDLTKVEPQLKACIIHHIKDKNITDVFCLKHCFSMGENTIHINKLSDNEYECGLLEVMGCHSAYMYFSKDVSPHQ